MHKALFPPRSTPSTQLQAHKAPVAKRLPVDYDDDDGDDDDDDDKVDEEADEYEEEKGMHKKGGKKGAAAAGAKAGGKGGRPQKTRALDGVANPEDPAAFQILVRADRKKQRDRKGERLSSGSVGGGSADGWIDEGLSGKRYPNLQQPHLLSTSNLQPATSNLRPLTCNLQPPTADARSVYRRPRGRSACSRVARGEALWLPGLQHESQDQRPGKIESWVRSRSKLGEI